MEDTIGFAIVIAVILFVTVLIRQYLKYEKEKFLKEMQAQRQQNEVFSISGRVQGQNPTQTLSSDAFVSIGHITASNQFNKPPTNDEPPSYEEAICLPVPDLRQTRIQVQQPPSHTVAMN
ncbi:uncharacterized protein LOC109595585 isoform X4 [Aethina tumida]|uniref:uncharacterized protein LOC109595585 isoform X4 n=1 Tax=Aethina tumida TaxID=116153 RepID=UPI00096AF5CB|nr:uncharacterized protein LOC109595585 isoform X4 [Aethina tumida]